MASPPILTPSGTTGFNLQSWQRGFEEATYQKKVFIPTIDDYGLRPYGIGNVRKKRRMFGSTLPQSNDGASLTASNLADTAITLTPVGSYVMVQWSENEDAQIDANLDAEAQGDVEMALAESTETNVLANVQSLTQFMSQAGVDPTMLRQAMGRLVGNTNGVAMPGTPGAPEIYGIFTNRQMPNLVAIPEVNQANFRGDSENPYVKGIWVKGFGFTLMISTVIANDANGDHNCLYIASAFVIGWNVRSRIKRQDFELTNKLIAFNNVGSTVKHDLRAIGLRTTASALS